MTVSGSDGSRIVVSAIDEGHLRQDAREEFRCHVGHRTHQEAARATAERHHLLGPGYVCGDEMFATAMKSVKVFFFSMSLPCSYHGLPNSPPPRTWAMTKTMPRSSSESLAIENRGSSHDS